MATYRDFYRRSIEDREGFWAEQAKLIEWRRPFERVLDYSRPPFARWFVGGETNLCHNALDRHVAARGEQPALVWISTEVNQQKSFTYRELLAEVKRAAAMMRSLGVEKGDRVIIYMPMVPEAAFAMLACARIGAIHSVVFGGFAPRELATRIDDAAPKVILSASCGIEPTRIVAYKPLLDEAIKLASVKPKKCLILQRPQAKAEMVKKRDLDWAETVGEARAAGKSADCVPVAAT